MREKGSEKGTGMSVRAGNDDLTENKTSLCVCHSVAQLPLERERERVNGVYNSFLTFLSLHLLSSFPD